LKNYLKFYWLFLLSIMPPSTKKSSGKSQKPAPTPAAASKPTKAKTSSKAQKAKAPVETAPVAVVAAPVETAVVAAPAVETVPNTVTELEQQFAAINARLSELRVLETSLVQDVRKLQKNAMKYLKEVSKKSRRRRAPAAEGDKKRAPSGFAKPALISNDLCSFLGKPQGTEMARTEVTKFLTTYIKEQDLQDPENRRRIRPDKKLQKLLNTTTDDEVTYFNLQRYMKVHFPPSKASALLV
jgi:chromatin remodeling complex protein RSC6